MALAPDPADKTLDAQADGAFSGSRRAGYGDALERALRSARQGHTLAAGEGLLIVQHYEEELTGAQNTAVVALEAMRQLREQLAAVEREAQDARETQNRTIDHLESALRDAETLLAEVQAERNALVKTLAALREPSAAVSKTAEQMWHKRRGSDQDPYAFVIRAAVAAAEKEVGA